MKATWKIPGMLLLMAALHLVGPMAPPASAQSAYRSDFDHFTTSWPLDGSHRNVDCERCHVKGMFKGTPRQCVACHSLAGLVKATPPPLDHIRTTIQCQDCHTLVSWAAVRRVDHTQVLGSCRSCHNNVIVEGKPPDHPSASNDCELCHRTSTWVITGAALWRLPEAAMLAGDPGALLIEAWRAWARGG